MSRSRSVGLAEERTCPGDWGEFSLLLPLLSCPLPLSLSLLACERASASPSMIPRRSPLLCPTDPSGRREHAAALHPPPPQRTAADDPTPCFSRRNLLHGRRRRPPDALGGPGRVRTARERESSARAPCLALIQQPVLTPPTNATSETSTLSFPCHSRLLRRSTSSSTRPTVQVFRTRSRWLSRRRTGPRGSRVSSRVRPRRRTSYSRRTSRSSRTQRTLLGRSTTFRA